MKHKWKVQKEIEKEGSLGFHKMYSTKKKDIFFHFIDNLSLSSNSKEHKWRVNLEQNESVPRNQFADTRGDWEWMRWEKGLPREGMWAGQMEMEKETVVWFNASLLKFDSDPSILLYFSVVRLCPRTGVTCKAHAFFL